MKFTRRQLRKLINEMFSLDRSIYPQDGSMSIDEYLESVNYNIDPRFLDLLVTLKGHQFRYHPKPYVNVLFFKRPAPDYIYVRVYPDDQTVQISNDPALPKARIFDYKSYTEASMSIPSDLKRLQ